MSDKRLFQTTSAAEFRRLVETAHASGRLNELIKAIDERLDRYRAALQTHQDARDFQQIHETKKIIAHLEGKLQIARQYEDSNPHSDPNIP